MYFSLFLSLFSHSFTHLHTFLSHTLTLIQRALLLCTRFEKFCLLNHILDDKTQMSETLDYCVRAGFRYNLRSSASAPAVPLSISDFRTFSERNTDARVQKPCPPGIDKGHFLIAQMRCVPILKLVGHSGLAALAGEEPLTKYNISTEQILVEEQMQSMEEQTRPTPSQLQRMLPAPPFTMNVSQFLNQSSVGVNTRTTPTSFGPHLTPPFSSLPPPPITTH